MGGSLDEPTDRSQGVPESQIIQNYHHRETYVQIQNMVTEDVVVDNDFEDRLPPSTKAPDVTIYNPFSQMNMVCPIEPIL